MCCLQSQAAFNSHYCKNPVVSKAIYAGLIGFGAGTTAVGVGVSTATSSGVAGIAAHFVSVPLLGGIAADIVSGAAISAAATALPIAAIGGVTIAGLTFLLQKNKTSKFSKDTGLNSLAQVVGQIIFLPMLAKCMDYVERERSNCESISRFAQERAKSEILKWGYTSEYADKIIYAAFSKSSTDLREEFESIIKEINKLKKKEYYKNIPKYELPTKAIRKIGQEMANSVVTRT